MDVLDYCNQILGEQVWKLSIPECYVLVMACYLHDVGMGITRDEYEILSQEIDSKEYFRQHPQASKEDIIREFHHDLSGLLIRRKAAFFDIPSEELLFAIIQVVREHRKTDLFDPKEYPDIQMKEGMICTSYLSAVLRLADEIDMGANRNPAILFDPSKLTDLKAIYYFSIHESIREVEVTKEAIILHIKLKEPEYQEFLDYLVRKINKTLDYCRKVAQQRSNLPITQERVEVVEADRAQ